MSRRRLTPDDRQSLKLAFRSLVEQAGGLVAAASATRVTTSTLARYYDLQDMRSAPPADVVADLERCVGAGEPPVTAELARLAGYRLTPLQAVGGAHLALTIADFARRSGEVPGALCDALSDGQLTEPELAQIGRLAARQAEQLGEISAQAHALASKSSPAAPAVKGEEVPVGGSPARGTAGGRRPRSQV